MLLELKRYLQQRPGCTVGELCQQLGTNEAVVQSMLDRLNVSPRQRVLQQRGCGDTAGGCGACPLKSACHDKHPSG